MKYIWQISLVLSICFSLFLYSCYPAKKTTIDKSNFPNYKEQLDKGSVLVWSGYNYTVERTIHDRFVKKFYLSQSKKMTDYISYADRKTNIKHGKVIAWYDNGNKYFEGNYKNNKKIGRWAYYAPESEKLVREGVYKDNLLDGTWISYDSTGRESFLEVYKEGVLLADSVLSTGNTPEGTSFFNPSSRPYLTKCENDSLAVQVACTRKTLLSKLLGEMKYPEKDRKLGVEGYALMSFIIDESGKVEQVKMLKSISESIEKECLKTVSNMPDWKPAKLNGKAVKVLYFLPFEFKLN